MGGSDGYYPPHSGADGGKGNAGGSGSGGGIYDLTGQCFLTNCTLAFNAAIAGEGGAGGAGGDGQFSGGVPGLPGPAGSASGGGINANGGSFLINALLASNAPGNASGGIIDGGHNLSSDNSCGFSHVGSLNNANPLLGPLMDNGGPTLTMALMPGSPAIDAGDNGAAPPIDQRGVPRPVGLASDIGAYECGPPGIIMPPQTQSVASGSTVDFSASAAGYPPLSYQWFFNGATVITGATNSVLHLVNVQPSQSGAYALVVTNALGAATSSPAMLDAVFRKVTRCTETILRLALAEGGTVRFAGDGTITLSNTIVIGTNTVLDGSGRQVTISGGNLVRVFYVNTNATLTLVNLTIADGLSTNGYGGGIYNEGTFNATNCLFAANTVQSAEGGYMGIPAQDGCGGAVYNSGALNLIDCSFVSNSACGGQGGNYAAGGGGGGGGAVYNSGALDIVDCVLIRLIDNFGNLVIDKI